MDLSFLPALNAALNATATVLLVVARSFAKRREYVTHARLMTAAFAVSALFLFFYVSHKVWKDFENTPFPGEGIARGIYLGILLTHVVLAMSVPVLAIRLIWLGRQDRRDAHRRLARVAWPIWIYVSITGVVIYAMLYHWPWTAT
ncbi:MAG: DUF420 domain-containing protein [Myxococcota bacterium]|nr:DUF420 domain-containing protein [Myxococcota bacterium]